jgi:hypothetical protein
MKTTRSLWIATLPLMFGQLVSAQDLKGDWQGTLSLGPNRQLRLILRIDKASDTTWKATLASIDQSPDWGAATRSASSGASGDAGADEMDAFILK